MQYTYTYNITRCLYRGNSDSWDYSYYPTEIKIGQAKAGWIYAFCHELAHALTTGLKKNPFIETDKELFKRELFCWRLGKSFCKSKYIDDGHAIECLKGYAESFSFNINWDKLKIIPINTNKYLNKELK